jgi:phenylpropionate dioxygenase-like ring-hydroxylating dioxygenase large terminal subunit
MIRDRWYIVLESKEINKGKLTGVTRLGEKMVFWRDTSGKLGCAVDLCPHRGVALSAGKVVGECVECPFHGFQYDSTGRCTLIPANGKGAEVPKAFNVKAFPLREQHGFVYLWWGSPREEYPQLPEFDFMSDPRYTHTVIRDLWKTHYSRAIENQLDVVHLPFVHHNSIGRGNQTLVNGPRYRVDEVPGGHDMLSFWYDNQVDQGQKPLKPNEMPNTDEHPLIQFRFPNLWHNWLGDTFHLFIAFVPIDDQNSLLYLGTYHTVKLPLVKHLFNFFSNLGNLFIERQDRRVVLTQRPLRSQLRMGEKMIPGDAPIIEYRRKRQKWIDAES